LTCLSRLLYLAIAYLLLLPIGFCRAQSQTPGFFPAILVKAQHEDNILRSESERESDSVLMVAPSLLYIGLMGKQSLNLLYRGDFGYFQHRDTEDFMDHSVDARFSLDLGPTLKINIRGSIQDVHEARGSSGARTEMDIEPDRARQNALGGELIYGRRTSTAQILLAYLDNERLYTNNDQESRDRVFNNGMAVFFVNLGPKTSLFAEARQSHVDYLNNAAMDLDSVENSVMVGVRWEATAKTTGEIKLGYISKNLKDPALDDFAGRGLEVHLLWEPKTYSRLNFIVSRQTDETTQIGSSYFVGNRIFAQWEHEFSDRLGIEMSLDYETDEFSRLREDDLFFGKIGVGYQLLRWLNIKAQYRYSSRSSNMKGINYKVNIMSLVFVTDFFKGVPVPTVK